jgi:hypothetical protein
MPEFTPVTGHCQCGAVAYRVDAPPHDIYHCHCSMCRRCHGTVFATYALVPRDKLTILKGADNLTTYDSSKGVHRKFCKTCGCQMFIHDENRPEMRWYMPGTADNHPGHKASDEKHIYVGSKLPWLRIQDDLPQYEEY